MIEVMKILREIIDWEMNDDYIREKLCDDEYTNREDIADVLIDMVNRWVISKDFIYSYFK